jgi:hypothetical protein
MGGVFFQLPITHYQLQILTVINLNAIICMKRMLTCTFVALASGCFGAYIGGQVSWQVRKLNCQTQPWGVNAVCQTWVAPTAIWQGSTTGLWMGWIWGALLSGLATRPSDRENEGDRSN